MNAPNGESPARLAPLANGRPCIVVGFDFSDGAEVALEEAARLASAHPGALVRVLTVCARVGDLVRLEHHGHVATVSDAAAAAALDLHIARALDGMVPPGSLRPNVSCHIAAGSPAPEIVRFAAEYDADVIVIGTHGRHGLERLLLGSVAEKVVRDGGCPVLVARRKQHALELQSKSRSVMSSTVGQ